MLRTKHARRSLPAGSQATARPNSDEVATPSWPAYAASGKSKSRATMPINSTKSKMRRSRSLSLSLRNKRSGSHKAPLPVLGGSSDNNSSTSSPILREKKVGGGGGKERSNPNKLPSIPTNQGIEGNAISTSTPPPHMHACGSIGTECTNPARSSRWHWWQGAHVALWKEADRAHKVSVL